MKEFGPWAAAVAGLLPLAYLISSFTKKRKKDMDTSMESFRFVRTGEEIKASAVRRAVAIAEEIAADEKKLAELHKAEADSEAAKKPEERKPPTWETPRFMKVPDKESEIENGIERKRDAGHALLTLARNVDLQGEYQLTFHELVFIGF